MPKVTITALPRQGFRGFGAIQRYFTTGVPEKLEVSDAEYEELFQDPATFFLKVEDGFVDPPQPKKPAASKPTDPDAK